MIKNNEINFHELANKFTKGIITQDEQDLFDKWYVNFDDEKVYLNKSSYRNASEIKNSIWEKISHEINYDLGTNQKVRTISISTSFIIAATSLIFLGIAYFFIFSKYKNNASENNFTATSFNNKNVAFLMLSNGQNIKLNNFKIGDVLNQSGISVLKVDNSMISYNNTLKAKYANTTTYNKLAVPKGSKYSIKLSDGTLAVIDAESTIKYPVFFSGDKREVEITGQVYFEVIHNSSTPFRIKVKNQIIEDIGTKFNVDAFDDESYVKTTLIEGSIKIKKGYVFKVLKPGQQAITTNLNDDIAVKTVNEDEIQDWKNGYFNFDGDDIHEVMRKLSRWYNIEPKFDKNLTNNKFGGSISKSKSLNEVLQVLSLTNSVHFKTEGNTIIVQGK